MARIRYHISSYSFRENYSFLNLEILANSNSCSNISIFYLINLFFAAETIQGRKLYSRAETIQGNLFPLSVPVLVDFTSALGLEPATLG